jgi:hypothetical protein
METEKIKTFQEILRKNIPAGGKRLNICEESESILSAAKEFHAQFKQKELPGDKEREKAIEFAEWCSINGWDCVYGGGWRHFKEGRKTNAELFDLFEQGNK